MLSAPTRLHDVDDCEMFVRATLDTFERNVQAQGSPGHQMRLAADEFEELVATGLVIMFELAERYDPHRPGYDQPGRFSGFAAMFLPRKLGDAWHRLHPEHRYVTCKETGRRHWEYDKPAVSLDGLRQQHDGEESEHRFDREIKRARSITDFVALPAAAA